MRTGTALGAAADGVIAGEPVTLDADVHVEVDGFSLDVALTAEAGTTVGVLGPNGAGKTTLLRVLAGLVALSAGRVRVGRHTLDEPATGTYVPPERRLVGVVFQDRLLFPHLSALDNVAFGLRCRGLSRAEARRRAAGGLEGVGLARRAGALPGRLSGGEARRVALARALVVRPRLLLLDEPLAGLDVATRAEVRRDLRRHLAGFDGVRLLVTHDPLEAYALADSLAVIEHGRVVQVGPPAELVARPRSSYVARLAGTNLFRGTAAAGDHVEIEGGGRLAAATPVRGAVLATVHPRAVALSRRRPEGSPRNVWPGRVEALEALDDRCRIRVGGRPPVVAEITRDAVHELALREGDDVWVSVKATEVDVYPA
ncbi:MAG: ABC transporter ATP-binding protein [Actinobacteria bacterium]|nr:ABC transporter ATP-binding protein [Actinomycetota bacterium]